MRHFGPANEVELTLYRSYWQEEPSGAFQIVARRTPLAGVDAAGLTAAIHQVDPDVPLEEVQTLDQLVSLNVSRPRFNVVLLGLFAGLATLLAALGIFGVQSYSVSQRRSEIGVHLALGAPPGRIARRIVGQSLAWTLLGVGLGCGLAILCSGSLASLLFEVSPLEPSAYLMAALLLCGVAALASYLPARRATRVDPTSALRETGA